MKTSFSRIVRTGIVSFITVTSVASAADRFWDGSSSNSWHDPSNWTSALPGVGDAANVDIASPVVISSDVTVNDIYVGKAGSSFGDLSVTGGNINVTRDFNFSDGIGSNTTFNMSGGTINTEAFRVGDFGISAGTQTNGSINTTADFVVQVFGEGSYNMSGGTNFAGSNLFVGVLNSSTGHKAELNISGTSVFNVFHEVRIGVRGTDASNKGIGELHLSSGTINAATGLITTRSFRVGGEGFGDGTLRVSGTGIINGRDIEIAEHATDIGQVIQTGGAVNLTGNLDLQMNGVGSYDLSGGTLSVDGMVDAIVGTFSFNGGKITRSSNGIIDYNGNLVTLDSDATLGLAFSGLTADKSFDISGSLDVNAGITFELAGLTLPSLEGVGDIVLGKVGSLNGSFTSISTLLTGLSNPANLSFISQDNPSSPVGYNPVTDNVYYLYKTGGNDIALHYNVVPEPSSLGLLAIGALGLLRRRSR